MTLDHRLSKDKFVFGDEVFTLFDTGGGKRKWVVTTVAGQPGDSKQVKSTPIELHAGFGASRRIRRGNGQPSDPAHHAFARNVMAQNEGLVHPSPRITYLDMSDLGRIRRGFRVGGYRNSKVGGGQTDNFVTNPGAEDGTITGWNSGDVVGPAFLTAQTTHKRSGAYGFQVEYTAYSAITNSGAGSVDTPIAFTKGGSKYITVAVKIPTAWDGGTIRVSAGSWVGAGGTTSADADLTIRDEWQNVIVGPLTVVAGDLSGIVRIFPVTAATVGKVYYFDDVVAYDALGGVGAIGGGTYSDAPQHMVEYGDSIYVLCGTRTFTVTPDAATPAVVESRFHGNAARARSADVFGSMMPVALGSAVDIDVATTPYSSDSPTDWSTVSGIARDVFKAGSAGRLFSSLTNKVWNILAGFSPLTSANYLPSNGEPITDASDPVRSLAEYMSALVAGTAKTVRTIDPNRGFEPVALIPASRLSASDFDGRSIIAVGSTLFHATTRGVYVFENGGKPVQAGPEILQRNETEYAGAEWGVPDFMGDYIAWPAYFPETGDSVIFFARLRDPQEVGTGLIAWHDVLYLDSRECRCVKFWGGSETRKPRLFFGAGESDTPYQVGWADLGLGSGPIPFTTDGQPATSSYIEWPLDDLGLPGVTKVVERIEIPNVRNADASNYVVAQVKADSGALTNLVKAQSGSNQERMNAAGFQQVFSQTGSIVSGKEIGGRLTFTQADAATSFVMVTGVPMLYYTEVPENVDIIETVIESRSTDIKEAEAQADAIRSQMAGAHLALTNTPDGTDRYARITDARVTEVEENGGKTERRLGIALTFREVMVA